MSSYFAARLCCCRSHDRGRAENPTEAEALLGDNHSQPNAKERDMAQKYYAKAVEYQSQGELQKAIAHFMQAVKLDGSRCDVLLHLGTALQDSGALDDATRCYQKALTLETDNHSAWYNLGYIMEETHQLEEAIKCFSEAARLAPNDQDALVNRGNCYMQIGDIENAIHSYEMVLQADESSVIAW